MLGEKNIYMDLGWQLCRSFYFVKNTIKMIIINVIIIQCKTHKSLFNLLKYLILSQIIEFL